MRTMCDIASSRVAVDQYGAPSHNENNQLDMHTIMNTNVSHKCQVTD